jgi:hypothetical protein
MRFVASPLGLMTLLLVLSIIIFLYRRRNSWRQPIEGWLAVPNRGLILWLCGLTLVLVVLFQPLPIIRAMGTDDNWFSYSFDSFFYASTQNRYHIPVGLGFVLMSIVLSSFLLASTQITKFFKPVNAWMAVSYAWIITAFLLVLGKYLSIAIIPFRTWLFLGLFASLFAAWGIVAFIQTLSKNYWALLSTLVLLVAIVIPTSFIQKQQFNTKIWRDSKIGKPQSRELFRWMREGGIPKNSVVAHLCGDSEFLTGYDMNPPVWDEVFHPKYREKAPYFIAHPLKITPEAYTVLKNAQVEYVTVGTSCLWQVYGDKQREAMQTLLPEALAEYMTDSRLTLVKNTGYEFLFKLQPE